MGSVVVALIVTTAAPASAAISEHPDAGTYEWKFAPASVPGGGTFTEHGAAMCLGTP